MVLIADCAQSVQTGGRMKQQFRGYYQPSSQEMNDLWARGLIVLDTNALLNFYRYSGSTRADFFSLLASIQERLWLPHQVGLEFHKNRLEVIEQQEQAFESIESALSKAKGLVEKELNGFRRHPSLNRQGITTALETGLSGVQETITESRRIFAETPFIDDGVDTVLVAITDLYDSRVGVAFDMEELAAIHAEGATRYEKSIPPGYKDQAKPEPDRYGDLVLWRQMLAQGAAMKLPVIFVTDDGKDDWWQNFKGKTIGPRVELIEEFYDATEQRIHFYTPERFLQYAKDRGGSPDIRAESIGEVQQVSEAPFRAIGVLGDQLNSLMVRRRHFEQEIARIEDSSTDRVKPIHREILQLEADSVTLKSALSEVSDRYLRMKELIVMTDHEDDRRDLLLQLDRISHERGQLQNAMTACLTKIEQRSRFEHRKGPSRSRILQQELERLDADIEKTALAIDELQ